LYYFAPPDHQQSSLTLFSSFPAPYNWDILLAIDDIRVFESIFDSHRVQISQAYHLPDPNDPVAVERTEVDVDYFSDFVGPDQDPSEPASDIYYPILDTIDAFTAENPKNEDFELLSCPCPSSGET
jgi:hypothetical protein